MPFLNTLRSEILSLLAKNESNNDETDHRALHHQQSPVFALMPPFLNHPSTPLYPPLPYPLQITEHSMSRVFALMPQLGAECSSQLCPLLEAQIRRHWWKLNGSQVSSVLASLCDSQLPQV